MTFRTLLEKINCVRFSLMPTIRFCRVSSVNLNKAKLHKTKSDETKSDTLKLYKINLMRSYRLSTAFIIATTFTFTMATVFFTTAFTVSTIQTALAKTSPTASKNLTKTTTETPKKNSVKASQKYSIDATRIALAEAPPTASKNPTKTSMNALSDAPTQNTEIPPMDTSHWLTFPVGRYLIDLPPSAKLYWHPLRFSSQYDLVWEKDMTIEQARELILKEAEEAKKAPHETADSQFIRMKTDYGINSAGIILMRYPHEYSTSRLLKTYFVNRGLPDKNLNKKKRVYYYEEKVIDYDTMVDDTIAFIDYMVGRIIPTYPTYPTQPISVTHGTYFEGGLFYGPGPAPYPAHEEIGIEVTFPEYPGIQFKIFFDHLNIDTNSIFRHINPNEKGVMRKARTTIAGNPAEEVLNKFEKNGITHYSFSLNGPSKRGENLKDQIPLILMHLKNPTTGVMRDGKDTTPPPIKRPSFKNDEEAMAVWDAIRRNIRWRPDGWRVEGPKKPYYMVGGKMIPYMVPPYRGK